MPSRRPSMPVLHPSRRCLLHTASTIPTILLFATTGHSVTVNGKENIILVLHTALPPPSQRACHGSRSETLPPSIARARWRKIQARCSARITNRTWTHFSSYCTSTGLGSGCRAFGTAIGQLVPHRTSSPYITFPCC
jgi:hypothetical protein